MLKPAQWKFLEEQAFTGFDNDANMVKIAILNLYLHQLEKAHLAHFNPITNGFGGSYPGRLFDVILANPPFAGKVQDESILSDLNYKLNTRATELLFLKWFIDHLAPGGRAGVIVPNGVLFGSNNAATTLRKLLLTECDLQAVVSLPSVPTIFPQFPAVFGIFFLLRETFFLPLRQLCPALVIHAVRKLRK